MRTGTITVLVVDDEDIVRMSLEEYLSDEGFEVFSTVSGEEALEVIKDNSIDIGVIDMRLPGMDGNTLILEAKKLEPGMKFIIHTGSMGYSLPEPIKELGIDNSLVFKKPIKDIGNFITVLRSLVK